MKLGVNSVDDLAKLKVSSIDDLAKIGIKNVDDLAKLGIGSSDLKKIGIDPEVFESFDKISGLLDDSGKFLDNTLENNYQDYVNFV